MAEAAVEQTPTAARFFCHQCADEVRPVLPDYICSRCRTGFIEELAQPPQEPTYSEEDEMDRTFDALIQSFHGSETTPNAGQNRSGHFWNRASHTQPHTFSGRHRAGAQNTDPRNYRAEGFLQQLIQSLTENTGLIPNTNFPVFVNLPGNPGDYVWGRGGWNAIITQLINHLDGTGPPPLSKEQIDDIPVVQINEGHIEQNLQCTVCMEDFVLNEPVRLLPCQHHFHNDCIVPWLQLHGTCPICRKLLFSESGQSPFSSDPNYASNADPGPSRSRDETSQPSTQQQQNDSPAPNSSANPSNSTFDFIDWD